MSLDSALQVYNLYRGRAFQGFQQSSFSLAHIIDRLVPLFALLSEVATSKDQSNTTAVIMDAAVTIRHLMTGIRTRPEWLRLSDPKMVRELMPEPNAKVLATMSGNIDVDLVQVAARIPEAAYETANRDLCAQLLVIRDAALLYTYEEEDGRRLMWEHNLVRAGAEHHDSLAEQFQTPSMWKYLEVVGFSETEELAFALDEYFALYQNLLAMYDFLAKLQNPEKMDPDTAGHMNEELIRRLLSLDPRDEELSKLQQIHYQLQLDVPVWF